MTGISSIGVSVLPQDSQCEPLRELYLSAFPLLVSAGAKRTMTLAFRVPPCPYFNFHPKRLYALTVWRTLATKIQRH